MFFMDRTFLATSCVVLPPPENFHLAARLTNSIPLASKLFRKVCRAILELTCPPSPKNSLLGTQHWQWLFATVGIFCPLRRFFFCNKLHHPAAFIQPRLRATRNQKSLDPYFSSGFDFHMIHGLVFGPSLKLTAKGSWKNRPKPLQLRGPRLQNCRLQQLRVGTWQLSASFAGESRAPSEATEVSWNHMLYDCILTSRCAGECRECVGNSWKSIGFFKMFKKVS